MYLYVMFILQISPRRMGSTWQFNVCREILSHTPCKTSLFDPKRDFLDYRRISESNYISKSHFFDFDDFLEFSQENDVKALVSIRNLYDTLKSSRRVFPLESDASILVGINNSLDVIQALIDQKIPCHFTFIDELESVDAIFAEIIKICEFLETNIDVTTISRLSSQLTKESVARFIQADLNLGNDFTKYDQQTFWHGDHIDITNNPDSETNIKSAQHYESVSLIKNNAGSPITMLRNQISEYSGLLRPLEDQVPHLTRELDEI